MARGMKKSIEEQIEILDQQIEKTQNKLDSLLSSKETLLIKQREEEVGELYNFLQENNISTSEIIEMLESNKESKSA